MREKKKNYTVLFVLKTDISADSCMASKKKN